MAVVESVPITRFARARRRIVDAYSIDAVAEQLNNTRAVCRKYYVHPAVLERYLAGTIAEGLTEAPNGRAANKRQSRPKTHALSPEEQAVLRLLAAAS